MNRLAILLFPILTCCASITEVNSIADSKLNKFLGQKIAIYGTAVNSKLGALLITKDGHIWIDAMKEWPNGYYLGGDSGKNLRVTGIVIEKYDLPVFIQNNGDLRKSEIPVPKGTDLKEASHRYLLQDAKWEIVYY